MIDWCTYPAARYAVEHWHYSGRMPRSKLAMLGAWEDQRFIGVVIFGVGASNNLHRPYGVPMTAVCELVRVALTSHRTPTSRIVRIACRSLHKHMPGLRLIVSFADQNYQHIGTIYQAAGWIYTGCAPADRIVQGLDGRWRHPRAHRLRYQTERGYTTQRTLPKYRDLLPMDDAMRQQIAPLAQPYPKRAQSILADAPASQAGEYGAAPICALTPPEE